MHHAHILHQYHATIPIACLSILQACPSFTHFLQIHAQIIRRHLVSDPFIASKLLEFCAASPHGSLPYARKLFDEIHQPNVFAWNALIRGHAGSPNPSAALRLFHVMLSAETAPNSYTLTFALKACARLFAFDQGEQLHGFILKSGADRDVFAVNGLISMYCACGQIELGQHVFDTSHVRDVASWNSMLSGYVDCGFLDSARIIFDEMPVRGIVSWNAMINGYVKFGDVGMAKELFDRMPDHNVESWNTLIAGYAKCGQLDKARKLFDEMPVRNAVSWSAMLSACAQGGKPSRALRLFEEMKSEGAWPNYAAIVSVLSACSQLGALDKGRDVHSYIKKNKMKMDSVIGTALINLYSKCGCIDKAVEIFTDLPHKNVFSWSAIIVGLAINGHGAKALELFSMMEKDGIRPNAVTFVGVLCACSHGGLVDLAKHYFNSMRMIYGIEPQSEHYGCMVDALGRAGLLPEAVTLVESIPGKGNSVLWVTLLGASWIHGNIKVGEMAVQRLIELKPNDGGVYVIMSNIYAKKGMWDKAREARMQMKSKGLNKEPSQSLIEMVELLKSLLVSDTPLTDMFLTKQTVKDKMQISQQSTPKKCYKIKQPTSSERISVKLLLKKDDNKLLYAEADNKFADLLASFLTYPLGSVANKLGGQSGIRCLDNLYNSIEALGSANCFRESSHKEKLQSPKLQPYFKLEKQLIALDEEIETQRYYMCRTQDCDSDEVSTIANAKCKGCGKIRNMRLNLTNPKYCPSDGIGTGGFLRN